MRKKRKIIFQLLWMLFLGSNTLMTYGQRGLHIEESAQSVKTPFFNSNFQFKINKLYHIERSEKSNQPIRCFIANKISPSGRNDNVIDQIESYSFFVASTDFNPNRFWGVFGTGNTAYATSMFVLSNYWYSDYEQSKFHFAKDGRNWLQIDKAGHVWTTYSETFYAYKLYRWSGLKKKPALYLSMISASIYQGSIEWLDGRSAEWGASWGDLLANTSGTLLYGLQEAAWDEQKIRLKFSSRKQDYSEFDPMIQERIVRLYGQNFWEQTLKDYNGQVYWLSFNPFGKVKGYPKWLNLAVGYGGNQLFGALENQWEVDGQIVDFSHVPRNRQYYLSLDIDFSHIHTKYPFLDFLIHSLNILKFPAPSLILEDGELNFRF